MKNKKSCKNCPYCYEGEYCLLEQEYIDDMNSCPDWNELDDEKDYVIVNGEKIYKEELKATEVY